jgi:HPr Serine kinase C-terminal domain
VSHATEIEINDPLLYAAPLPHTARFYPMGFPLDIRAGAREVLAAAEESWGLHPARYSTEPLRVHVLTSEGSGIVPPEPVFRGQEHLLTIIADQDNFAICHPASRFAFCSITRATLADQIAMRWHFLEGAVYILLELNFFTAMHAACVAWEGAGVMLHGESGVGKSTLTYACARRGWTYITDDATSILFGRRDRTVIGEPYRFRFRKEASEIFPELRGLTVGHQIGHKPTIEVLTSNLPIRTAAECRVEKIVFLQRRPGSRARVTRIGKQEAWERLRKEMAYFGREVEQQRVQAVESLVEAPAFEMCYGSFEDALPLLDGLRQ